MVSFQPVALSFLKNDFVWCGFFSSYRQEKINSLALHLAKVLQEEPRQSIPLAQSNKKVSQVRNFLKNLSVKGPQVSLLERELLAARLGISRAVLECNQGFEAFAKNYHLERYLLEYKEEIRLSPENKILLKVQKGDDFSYESWENISALFEGKDAHKELSQPWVYGPFGIQKKDMYEWSSLLPYKYEDPAQWDHKFVFEVCVCLTGSPRSITGNHSWLRLKTPQGEVYSVGLYRTGKHGPNKHWKFPLKVMSGELMSPDVSEFWPTEIRRIQFAITPEGFAEVKRAIEEEKQQGTCPFEDFDENCTHWVLDKAKIAGISLEAKESLFSLFLPRKIEALVSTIWRRIAPPQKITSLGSVAVAILVNGLQYACGAGQVDAAVQGKAQARISSIRDLLNPEKMQVYHPYTIADKMMPVIMRWREQEIERVRKAGGAQMEQEISRISFDIPRKLDSMA